jgi:hypothetical protein
MYLTEQEVRFLAQRTRLVNAWRYVGVVLLVGLAGFAGWLFWFAPLLANPFTVLTRLENSSIPPSTMALSTAMLPIVFLTCIVLALAIVLFVFAAISNERKYLSIVQRTTGISISIPSTVTSIKEDTSQSRASADAATPRR